LPLFNGAGLDDEPLIVRPSPPRQPLDVRRATPEVPRVRSEPRAQSSFDLSFDADAPSSMTAGADMPRRARPSFFDQDAQAGDGSSEDAGVHHNASLVARLAAVVIDLVILAIVDVIALYFTLQLSGLALIEIGVLPKVPLLAFLILQNGGYFV